MRQLNLSGFHRDVLAQLERADPEEAKAYLESLEYEASMLAELEREFSDWEEL